MERLSQAPVVQRSPGSPVDLEYGVIMQWSQSAMDNSSTARVRRRNIFGKAISYAVGFVSRKRPCSTEPQIGLSYTVEKGLFRLNFFRLRPFLMQSDLSVENGLFRLTP